VTSALTVFALIAFAANSVLCRLALGHGAVDPASFTSIRLLSGAVTLAGLWMATAPRATSGSRGSLPWVSAALLFLYAAPFSFAYISLGAGTGALVLFACVQATMLAGALGAGERFRWLEAAGLAIALGGLAYLVFPGLRAPSPIGSALMAIAGISWGLYSLRGRASANPVADTARNFALAVPLAALLSVATLRGAHLSWRGALLAAASGALASGLGYVSWYAALRGLTRIRAATVQLTVPILAAAAGVALLGETVTVRLVLSAILILGGVGLALAGRAKDAASGGR
jgi:drug/metabolite transporter (DMT)-like permease